MKDAKPVEIQCPACGQDSLLLRKPHYEGFTRTGDDLSCASCGHPFASEAEVPFKGRPAVKVFTDADRSREVKVFNEHEADRLCRHCANYMVNPFTQWCTHHRKEVQATDTCAQFHRRPPAKPAAL